jgi:hypothetical protein
MISPGYRRLSSVDNQEVRPRSIRKYWTSRFVPEAPRGRCQVSLGVRASRRKCFTRLPVVRLR